MTEHNELDPVVTEAAENPPWTPPATLTPPSLIEGSLPVLPILAALGIALASGVGLWASSQVFYIYIFYNMIIGGFIGWALALAPKKHGFSNVTALMVPGVLFCALPYVVMRVGFFVQLLPSFREQGYEPSLFEFLVVFLENDTLFGLEIGLYGNIALLLVEIGITVYALHGRLLQGIAEARIASVPNDVVDFVIQGFANDWDTARVREELGRRGWKNADDQDRAIGTGFDVIAAIQAAQQPAS